MPRKGLPTSGARRNDNQVKGWSERGHESLAHVAQHISHWDH